MVQHRRPAQTGLDGFAAYDTTRKIVNVVFGDDSGDNTVRVTGLSGRSAPRSVRRPSCAATTGRYVTKRRPSLSRRTYTVASGPISVPVTEMDARARYQLLITPTSGVPA